MVRSTSFGNRPEKVSSASTVLPSPPMGGRSRPPRRSASMMRWCRNQAVLYWQPPSERCWEALLSESAHVERNGPLGQPGVAALHDGASHDHEIPTARRSAAAV